MLLKRQYNIFDTQEQRVRQEICSFVYEEIKDIQKMQFIILILYLMKLKVGILKKIV